MQVPSVWSIAVVVLLAWTSVAGAEVIGTFRWRLEPYCNVITLTVEQQGASFLLHGFDDLCGAPQQASATGTAQLNPNGSVGLGVTVLRPGVAVHHTATISLPSVTGTWTDDFGNAGNFAFNPQSPATGTPRPATLRGTYVVRYRATAGSEPGTTAFSFGHTLQSPPQVHFVPLDVSVPECPGTAFTPRAQPGHLCVYEQDHANTQSTCVVRIGGGLSCGGADRSGAGVSVLSVTAGGVFSSGTWAVTVP